MNKRGQVTTFVVLGIVIVAILLLILYARQTIFFPTTPDSLNSLLDEISDEIIECIGEVSKDPIIRIALQGGYLKPDIDTYRLYNDTTISYLCYDIPKKPQCRNRMLLISDMEEQLNLALKARILSCTANLDSFTKLKPIIIETPKEMKIDTKINLKTVDVTVKYLIVVRAKKGDTLVQRDSFIKTFDYPLGDLYNVAHDIIDSETEDGEFDQLFYMIAKKVEYKVYKYRPYPDKLYTLKRDDNDYQFQFFVQGEPS